MKKTMMILCVVLPVLTYAADWWTVRVDTNGQAIGKDRTISCKDHVFGDNDYDPSYVFPTNEFKYWKKVSTNWTAMSTNEMAVVDAATKSNAVADVDLSVYDDALLGYLADKFNKTKEELRGEVQAKVNKNKNKKEKNK